MLCRSGCRTRSWRCPAQVSAVASRMEALLGSSVGFGSHAAVGVANAVLASTVVHHGGRHGPVRGRGRATAVLLWPQDQPFGAATGTTPSVGSVAARAAWSQARAAARRPTPTTTTASPGVLWQRSGSDRADGDRFVAPIGAGWSGRSTARASPATAAELQDLCDSAFRAVSVQAFAVRGRGGRWVNAAGRSHLQTESVCDRWVVTAVRP